MGQFMLLLHENPADFADVSPQDIQRIICEYSTWRDQLEAAGQLVGGDKLKDEGGRLLTVDGAALRVVDGPFAEAKEVIGGYFTIEAEDYDAAVDIARACPHLKYGGKIHLREIDLIH